MAKILIADDESSLRTLIQVTLESPNLQTVFALDGTEALQLAQEVKFDLILLDWMMPGLNGIDVLKQLRERPETANVPVIMLTARGQNSDQERAMQYGATAYLVKPFSPLELLERIQKTLKLNGNSGGDAAAGGAVVGRIGAREALVPGVVIVCGRHAHGYASACAVKARTTLSRLSIVVNARFRASCWARHPSSIPAKTCS